MSNKKKDDYEEEVWTDSNWTMSQFNGEYYSMFGLIQTPSTGDTRIEIVGCCRKEEADRISTAHNQSIAKLKSQLADARQQIAKLRKCVSAADDLRNAIGKWVETTPCIERYDSARKEAGI